jgi:hypothetical protein
LVTVTPTGGTLQDGQGVNESAGAFGADLKMRG